MFEELFYRHGAIEDFIKNGNLVPLKPYAEDPKLKEGWPASHRKHGFEGLATGILRSWMGTTGLRRKICKGRGGK